jgi:2-desacetyl-2-hydroxyethyl bacteriochlorophyllide A dehydrogenase
MKALVMKAAGSWAVREVSDPVMGDYDAQIEMVVCGVCNSTDKMLRNGTFAPGVTYPSILGHESVGRVTAVGSQVRYLKPGQLVTRCSAYGWDDPPLRMYWGGFSERGVLRDSRAWLEDHPGETAADQFPHIVFDENHSAADIALSISLAENFSIVAEAGGMVGDVVGVNGTGIAGLSLVAFARLLGAESVICVGRRKKRLELAVELGATHTAIAGPEADDLFRELGGAHVVFEASGKAPAIDAAYRWVRPGGQLIIYSAPDEPVPLNVMAAPREAALTVARPREAAVLRSVVGLVESGYLNRDLFLSGTYPLDRVGDAFAAIDEGSVIKALVSFGAE